MQLLADQIGDEGEIQLSTPHRATRFARSEDGNLTVLGLIMGSLMIAFGGFAVDMMRYENTRAALQNTLDRASLAAASMTQELAPEDVVADYFAKAGLSEQLVSVVATQGVNFRTVEARAEADTLPFFLNMVGLQEMHVSAHSGAEQRITNIEVTMVLDVSTSMASNSKLANLKVAAKEFVSTLMTDDVEHKISIGMVPFSAQVNLGPDLIGLFNATHQHGVADVYCLDLPDTAYATQTISLTEALPMTSAADTTSNSSGTGWSTSNRVPAASLPWCPPVPGNFVRLPGQDIATLQGNIDALQAKGYTSINMGMRWGLTMMDPILRDAYAGFIGAAKMPDTLAERPSDFGDNETMKVLVLMTDGEHYASERVNDEYKTGPSPLWKATDGFYSILHDTHVDATDATTLCNSRPYWVAHLSQWHSRPWNGVAPAALDCYDPTATYADTTLQNWEEIWAVARMSYVVNQFYVRALGGTVNFYMNHMTTTYDPATMDDQLQEVCAIAKAQGVIVYGIAFEAPTNGEAQIRACATSDAHYFDAEGTQISTAFQSIASNLSQLRLTQ